MKLRPAEHVYAFKRLDERGKVRPELKPKLEGRGTNIVVPRPGVCDAVECSSAALSVIERRGSILIRRTGQHLAANRSRGRHVKAALAG
jgi:hypothetical protein